MISRTRSVGLLVVLFLTAVPAISPVHAQFGPENAAMGVLDAFMGAFNDRDDAAMCRTFHYPHVRLASGTVRTYASHEDCVEQIGCARLAERFGWDHSGWDSRTVVQANTDKVHVAVIFSRYDAADELIAQFDSLYIVTRVDGRWAIRSRSSFAP
jgi:hypothetical protein